MREWTLTPTDAAAQLGVHRETLRDWLRKGHVPAIRLPSGRYLLRQADVDELRDSILASSGGSERQ